MGGFLGQRIGKPILMFLITFFAVRLLTGSPTDGVLVGLIPFVLGAINVFSNIGYALTAISVMVAVAWTVTPIQTKTHLAASVYQSTGLTLAVTAKPLAAPAGASPAGPQNMTSAAPANTPSGTNTAR